MLYGSYELQKEILKDVFEYSKENKLKPVFGAMVGSISKGLHYADSDYDTRFLYLREDFPEKICIPKEMKEEELVKRYFLQNKVYEWIPFWEMTSFLQFLLCPSFKNDFSVGLYNIVGWTFQSPYVWDPYGLQNKLLPLINQIFYKGYEIEYHKNIIEKYGKEFGRDMVISKSYLYSIHSAATIEWSDRYQMQPPINLQTLLLGLGKYNLWLEVKKILSDAQDDVRKNIKGEKIKMHDSHFRIRTKYNTQIEDYIKSIYKKVETEHFQIINRKEDSEIVNDMYCIIKEAVFNDEKLLYCK